MQHSSTRARGSGAHPCPFWAFLAGYSYHLAGVLPALLASFSLRLLCCTGADTIVASTIWPLRAMPVADPIVVDAVEVGMGR